MKSDTCFRKDGEPRSVYHTAEAAREAARYVTQEKNIEFSAYQCSVCQEWHICPSERQTPSIPCVYCTGSDGKPKLLYETYNDARRRADFIYQERNLNLIVYECPYGDGFHLTKA